MKFDFTGLLKNEMKPALGVTEVGAIALAAARAYAAVGGKLQEIRMVMNGGMYKNHSRHGGAWLQYGGGIGCLGR